MDRWFDDDGDDVVAVPRPGPPEERLDPRIVQLVAIDKGAILVERPTGEGTRRVLDVGFGVVAEPERKELHDLAREILVRMRGDVVPVVEPDEHRRIFRDRR